MDHVARACAIDGPVLLLGEPGVGKGYLARRIHGASRRSSNAFVVLDCAALAPAEAAAKLFGLNDNERGALEDAAGGSLFLRHVEELPMSVQQTLARALESGEFKRVQSESPLRTNARVMASSDRNLSRDVKLGKFREELLNQLAPTTLSVPPLRDRRADLKVLIKQILLDVAPASEFRVAEGDLKGLASHEWPGNVGELRRLVEKAVNVAQASSTRELALTVLGGLNGATGANGFEVGMSYKDTRAIYDTEFEKRYVLWLLGRHRGNVSAAAREARMDRKHLHDIAKKHGLRGPSSSQD
jgi:DNA-binding NtrC family response regulator